MPGSGSGSNEDLDLIVSGNGYFIVLWNWQAVKRGRLSVCREKSLPKREPGRTPALPGECSKFNIQHLQVGLRKAPCLKCWIDSVDSTRLKGQFF